MRIVLQKKQSPQKVEGMSVPRRIHDYDREVRTSWLQLSAHHWQEALQHRMCRSREEYQNTLPVQAPRMQRNRAQDVGLRALTLP